MRLACTLLSLMLIATPAAAFDTGDATRIMVVPDAASSEAPALRQLCRSLADSLRSAGREVFVFEGDPLTVDRMGVQYVVFVSAAEDDAVQEGLIGLGTIADSGVGASIDLVRSFAAARVQLLDPASLEVLDSFEVEETEVRPMLSSINIGDSHNFLRIPIWFGRRSREQAATRVLGSRIATRLITSASE